MRAGLLPLLLLSCWTCPTRGYINCTGHGTREQEDYCKCPFRDEDPCECTLVKNDKGAVISYTIACYWANQDQFPLMMDKVRNAALPVHTLFLTGCNVTLPRVDIFRTLPFSSVRVVRSTVLSPAGQSPDAYQAILGGLEKSVTSVSFRDSLVQGVDATSCALGALSELRNLSLAGAQLKHIPDDFFCCSYLNLEEVYLYNNAIPELRRGALSRAQALRLFNANNNVIFKVDRQFFHDPAQQLQEIHLRYNQISTLPNDMFSNMPALKVVDLSHNKISILPAITWSILWTRLPDIYLDGNQLECKCDLDWLARLEEKFSRQQRWNRFLTGQCTSPKDPNTSTLLDDLNVTDVICP